MTADSEGTRDSEGTPRLGRYSPTLSSSIVLPHFAVWGLTLLIRNNRIRPVGVPSKGDSGIPKQYASVRATDRVEIALDVDALLPRS